MAGPQNGKLYSIKQASILDAAGWRPHMQRGRTAGQAQEAWNGQLCAGVGAVVGYGVAGHITAHVLLEVDQACRLRMSWLLTGAGAMLCMAENS